MIFLFLLFFSSCNKDWRKCVDECKKDRMKCDFKAMMAPTEGGLELAKDVCSKIFTNCLYDICKVSGISMKPIE